MRKATDNEHNKIKDYILSSLKGEIIRNYIGLILFSILELFLIFIVSTNKLNNNANSNPMTYITFILLFIIVLFIFIHNMKKINRYKSLISEQNYTVEDCISEDIEIKYADFIDNTTRLFAKVKRKKDNQSLKTSYQILNEINSSDYHSFLIEFKNAECLLIKFDENFNMVMYSK